MQINYNYYSIAPRENKNMGYSQQSSLVAHCLNKNKELKFLKNTKMQSNV